MKSQRSVTFPTVSLEPLRYTVENGNGTKASRTRTGTSRTETRVMEVEDVEVQQQSLKRPLTPPTTNQCEPPSKRLLTEEEVEDQIEQKTYIDEVDGDEGDEAGEDGEAGGDGKAGESDEAGDGGDSPQGGAAVDSSDGDEILLNNLPKVYDLFATCVSVNRQLLCTCTLCILLCCSLPFM